MNDVIDYNDKSLFEDNDVVPLPDEKEFYTPEEACERVMSNVYSIYSLKHTV